MIQKHGDESTQYLSVWELDFDGPSPLVSSLNFFRMSGYEPEEIAAISHLEVNGRPHQSRHLGYRHCIYSLGRIDKPRPPMMPMEALLLLWEQLCETPVCHTLAGHKVLDSRFLHFGEGTRLDTIWDWFVQQNPQFTQQDVRTDFILSAA